MPFSSLKTNINITLSSLNTEQESLCANRQSLENVNPQIAQNAQTGQAEDSALNTQKTTLEGDIQTNQTNIANHKGNLATDHATYDSTYEMVQTVPDLNDDYPILMFPVRLETRFHKDDNDDEWIWIRVFPDQISIEKYEDRVKQAEKDAVKAFWEKIWLETDRNKCIDEWNALVLRWANTEHSN